MYFVCGILSRHLFSSHHVCNSFLFSFVKPPLETTYFCLMRYQFTVDPRHSNHRTEKTRSRWDSNPGYLAHATYSTVETDCKNLILYNFYLNKYMLNCTYSGTYLPVTI